MTVLFQMLAGQVQLLQRGDFARLFQRFRRLGYGLVLPDILAVFAQYLSLPVIHGDPVIRKAFQFLHPCGLRAQMAFFA